MRWYDIDLRGLSGLRSGIWGEVDAGQRKQLKMQRRAILQLQGQKFGCVIVMVAHVDVSIQAPMRQALCHVHGPK